MPAARARNEKEHRSRKPPTGGFSHAQCRSPRTGGVWKITKPWPPTLAAAPRKVFQPKIEIGGDGARCLPGDAWRNMLQPRERSTMSQSKESFGDYAAFVEKFKPKKTTDDCITPPEIYAVVLDYVRERWGVDADDVVRPFWPGGTMRALIIPKDAALSTILRSRFCRRFRNSTCSEAYASSCSPHRSRA